MKRAFRAVAVDFDGTLTSGERPSDDVLSALRETRAAGLKLLLVTGRIIAELRRDFPEVGDYFDAVVAENGAVIWSDVTGSRALVPAVGRELAAALVARGVSLTRGDVMLATAASFDGIALEEIGRLGLDCQLVRNRGALMILPAGISKGTGLSEALGDLGISHHNVIGFGDAENDHTLLEVCEIGVAVANAIPALKRHADVILDDPDGAGIGRFLRRLVRDELPRATPTRWRVAIGTRTDGTPATLPGSGINVLIAGGSGSGKSHLAGLLAERLVRLGYSICVLDPEGDHTNLGLLRGVVTVGGADGLPAVPELGRLLKGRFGGAVVDLSLTGPAERATYSNAAIAHLQERRASTGLPHWIFLDEAHFCLGTNAAPFDTFRPAEKGFCLVTYHPSELPPKTLAEIDVLFLLTYSDELARALLSSRRLDLGAGFDVERAVGLVGTLRRGEALMVTLGREARAEIVVLGARRSPHVRHWHKYVHGYLPPRLHFAFRDDRGLTGRSAANLEDFHRELQIGPATVLAHHMAHGDFSRWVAQALHDDNLAAVFRDIERAVHRTPVDIETARGAFAEAVERRYGDAEEPAAVDPRVAAREGLAAEMSPRQETREEVIPSDLETARRPAPGNRAGAANASRVAPTPSSR